MHSWGQSWCFLKKKAPTSLLGSLLFCAALLFSDAELIFGQQNCPFSLTQGLFPLILFSALLLGMIHYFAVNTEFTVSWIIGASLILIRWPVIEVSPREIMAPGSISAIVEVLLVIARLLLPLLQPECGNLRILCDRILFLRNSVNPGWFNGCPFVHFQAVFCVEDLIGFIHGEPSLILVRDESTDVFRRRGPKDLHEQEIGKEVDVVVAKFCEVILQVAIHSLLCWSFGFDTVWDVTLLEDMKQLLHPGEIHPGVIIWPVGQIGKAVNDEFVIWDCHKLLLEKGLDVSPHPLCRHEQWWQMVEANHLSAWPQRMRRKLEKVVTSFHLLEI